MMAKHSVLVSTRAPVIALIFDESGVCLLDFGVVSGRHKYLARGLTLVEATEVEVLLDEGVAPPETDACKAEPAVEGVTVVDEGVASHACEPVPANEGVAVVTEAGGSGASEDIVDTALDGTKTCDASGDENISGEERDVSHSKISPLLAPTGFREATSLNIPATLIPPSSG